MASAVEGLTVSQSVSQFHGGFDSRTVSSMSRLKRIESWTINDKNPPTRTNTFKGVTIAFFNFILLRVGMAMGPTMAYFSEVQVAEIQKIFAKMEHPLPYQVII